MNTLEAERVREF